MRLALLVLASVASSHAIGYDTLVDTIVRHAQTAAQRKNSGDEQGADAAVKAGLHALELAKKMDPEHPQAYITGGTFFLNMNRFEESLAHWRLAKAKLDPGNEYHAVIDERIKYTQLGQISVERDRVYQVSC